MQLTKIYGSSLDKAQKQPCGQGKDKVKKVLGEVFHQGVSSARSEECDQEQRQATPHQNGPPGKAKQEPGGRGGSLGLLSLKRQVVQGGRCRQRV